MINLPRFVITGIGHSGTGYIAQVLQKCGIPCGHEAFFHTILWETPPHPKVWGDSSWLFFGYLDRFKKWVDSKDLLVFYQKRDVEKIRRSLKHQHQFTPNNEEPGEKNPVTNYTQFLLDRDINNDEERIEKIDKIIAPIACLTYNVEDITPTFEGKSSGIIEKILDLIGCSCSDEIIDEAIRSVPTNVNQHVLDKSSSLIVV